MQILKNIAIGCALLGALWVLMAPPEQVRGQTTGSGYAGAGVACTVNVAGLNLRSGPGADYGKLDLMSKGTVFTATERLTDATWLYGASPKTLGWTTARFLLCPPNALTQLPVSAQFTQTTTSQAQPGAAPTTPAAPAPAGANSGGFTLLQPLDARISGQRTFQWQAGLTLAPNQAFELVLWEADRDPLASGFSLVGPTRDSSINVNLDKLTATLPQLQTGKSYQWGVLLVQARPYRRLQFLGGGHRFLFAAPAGTGGGGGGASSSDVTPPPPPKAPPK